MDFTFPSHCRSIQASLVISPTRRPASSISAHPRRYGCGSKSIADLSAGREDVGITLGATLLALHVLNETGVVGWDHQSQSKVFYHPYRHACYL